MPRPGRPARPPDRGVPADRTGAARRRPTIERRRSRTDRRPRRPDARRGPRAGRARWSPGRTCPAASRWSRAARRPTRLAGSAGSGRGRASSRRSVATRPGRALVEALRTDGVTPRVVSCRRRTDRPDRGRRRARWRAQLRRRPRRGGPARARRPASRLVRGADAVHLPVYSLLGVPLGCAGRRAIELARAADAAVSIDLASIGPLLADGRRAARALIAERRARPAVRHRRPRPRRCWAAAAWTGCSTSPRPPSSSAGRRAPPSWPGSASSRSRFEVATERVAAADTTGAGDAFDAGFLVGWFAARAAGGRCRPRSSGRRWRAIGRRRASSPRLRPRAAASGELMRAATAA